MVQTKQILTAAGTLGCAVAIGFVMQGSDQAERLYGTAPADGSATTSAVAEEIDASNVVLKVEGITLTSGELDLSLDLPATDPELTKVSAPQLLPEPAFSEGSSMPSCEVLAHARPMAGAMVNLTLEAACLPNERVTVHNNGMIFTQTTSAKGTLDLNVPALAEEAVYIMAFSNGEGAVAQTKVEDFVDFDRVVLQWKGDTGFEIHAREFGADYGSNGHVWQGAPGDIASAIIGDGGFTLRYGDVKAPDALLAEVYSFPKAANGRLRSVELTVETEVSDINCGLEIEAQTLEIQSGSQMKTRNLTLSVPGCDATGNFLVLNNLLQDLKVAIN
ncbi:MAG: hypothetical protein WBB25_16540 [Sulfitobacter sp.]